MSHASRHSAAGIVDPDAVGLREAPCTGESAAGAEAAAWQSLRALRTELRRYEDVTAGVEHVLDRARQFTRAGVFALFLVEGHDILAPAGQSGGVWQSLPTSRNVLRGQAFLGEILAAAQPRAIAGEAMDDACLPWFRMPGCRSLLLVPMFGPDGVLGLVLFGWRSADPVPPAVSELATALAHDIGDWLALRQAVRSLAAALQATKQAERSKKRFLWAVGHDLRTPLNVIQMASTLIRDALGARLRPSEHDMFARLEAGVSRAATVLNDLAELSDLQSGCITVQPKPFELRVLLSELVSEFRPAAERKGLCISWAMDADVTLSSDRTKLKRVLGHLLDNAVKFTPRGQVLLWAGLTPDPAATAPAESNGRPCEMQLHIAVSDTGPGVQPEQQPHVFDEFYQLDNPERTPCCGAGQGLALARHLTLLMGMEIQLNSSPGDGATFTVIVPACQLVRDTSAAGGAGKPAGGPSDTAGVFGIPPTIGQNERILVVDDDDETVSLLVTLLETFGFVAHGVQTGEAALEAIARRPPDLILLDLIMPGMSGLEITRRLKAEPSTRPIPVIALTGDMAPECTQAARKIGCAGLLSKPVKRDDLLAQICETLHSSAERVPGRTRGRRVVLGSETG